MKGVSPSLMPQLMTEINDVTHFTRRGAITALAGVDPGVNGSGTYEQKTSLLPNADPPPCVRLYSKSWTFLSKQSRMPQYICLWVKNGCRANPTMCT